MTVKSKHHGHPIELKPRGWVYSDTKEPISQDTPRTCGKCGLAPTKEGHDGCLGTLPGLMNACCGHGRTSAAYIQFWTGRCVRGRAAKKLVKKLKEQIK